ncbi:DUF305 domain-containing protein [Nocardioides sp. GCM10028917]|uniref:DUF305 domain-containing protein n=1 Tax=Nocardioides sp. GCM10028917 TaxID=3273408 RepID=UPI00361322E5
MASRSDSVPRAAHATRRWPVVLVGLALVLGSVACTADDPPVKDDAAPVVQLGAPGEAGKTLSPDEAEAIEEPTWTDADVEFVQGMIPHHQQALEMTALVGDRADDPDLTAMAERIEVSQLAEIDQLEGWLAARGESVSGMHAGHGDGEHGMPGMLSPQEMARLERASGPRFDQLFLLGMIRHHEGAVLMVESLLTEGEGGQESEVFQLAGHIGSDQQVEIAAMKRKLAEPAG